MGRFGWVVVLKKRFPAHYFSFFNSSYLKYPIVFYQMQKTWGNFKSILIHNVKIYNVKGGDTKWLNKLNVRKQG